MDVYRALRDCCVCGKPLLFLQPRYEAGGITAHLACAQYVEHAALQEEYRHLSIVGFRERMYAETQEIEK